MGNATVYITMWLFLENTTNTQSATIAMIVMNYQVSSQSVKASNISMYHLLCIGDTDGKSVLPIQ